MYIPCIYSLHWNNSSSYLLAPQLPFSSSCFHSIDFPALTMIHSLFLINNGGDLFLEKHWKSVISRSVCDYFFEAREKAVEPDNVPPVIRTPHHYLINIYREKIFFVSVIQTEVPPLFVIEFLHRIAETFQVH